MISKWAEELAADLLIGDMIDEIVEKVETSGSIARQNKFREETLSKAELLGVELEKLPQFQGNSSIRASFGHFGRH